MHDVKRQTSFQMKTPIRILLLLAVLTLGFTSCVREDSTNVNQDSIWVHYELFYDANTDVTTARATFRFGGATGTKLELTDPSFVSFDSEELSFKSVTARYEKDFPGYVNGGTFYFLDLDYNTFYNTVEMRPIDFQQPMGPIDNSSSFEIEWSGVAISDGELVSVWIDGENEGDAQLFLNGDDGDTSIILPLNQLENIGEGTAQARIERSFFNETQEASPTGALLQGRYHGVDLDVEIE